jgi:hypothetical protein
MFFGIFFFAALIGLLLPTVGLLVVTAIWAVAMVLLMFSLGGKNDHSGDGGLAWFAIFALTGMGLAGSWVGRLIGYLLHLKFS